MLCGKQQLEFFHKLRDDDEHSVYRCQYCGHYQVAPLPTCEEDEEFYQDNGSIRKLIPEGILDDNALMLNKEPWADHEMEITLKSLPANRDFDLLRILEIGSGYGWFIEKMRRKGFSVDGIEISATRRAMVKKRSGIELMNFNFLNDELPSNMYKQYDCMVMFYLLEHLSEPIKFIRRAMSAVTGGGIILLSVPNFNDYLKEISAPFNDHFFFREHLSYFTPETLKCIIEKAGLVDCKIQGCQMYSLENAIHWARNGAPFLKYSQIDMPSGLEWIGEIYKERLNDDLKSNFIYAIAKVPEGEEL
jgi:2-polyprenyl-3-methyl-5-hydroxy-6-metoxy-1,4-benzoquinol methylase